MISIAYFTRGYEATKPVTGAYIVYPWYRARPPEGADLTAYPRSLLLSKPTTSAWHTFGMESKEHIAWVAPIRATAVGALKLIFPKREGEGVFRWLGEEDSDGLHTSERQSVEVSLTP